MAAGRRANSSLPHSSPCVRNGRVQRPVVPAWKHQWNTSDSRRNAAVWRERPRPSSTAGFWRKWRKPGRSSPRRPRQKAFIIRSLLGIVLLCQAQPYLRHLQQRRPRFRVLDGVCHIQALLDVAPILVGTPRGKCPCANPSQRREPALRSGHQVRAVHAQRPAAEPDTQRQPPGRYTGEGHPEIKTPPEWPRAEYFGPRAVGSARLREGACRYGARTRRGAQQPHGRDHVATVENAHQLGDRQFGVAVGRVEINCELRLRGAHRIEKLSSVRLSYARYLVSSGKENARRRFRLPPATARLPHV